MGGMRRWMAGVLMMALAACGPAAGTQSAPASGGPRLISEAEIDADAATNLLELVQRLRPSWIQQRAVAGGRGFPTVFLGSQALGSVDRLREMGTHNVREVRYLNGPEATSRFGPRVPYGVIQVVLDIGG